MKQLFFSAYAASNVGKRRQNNEDNYYLNNQFVNSQNEACADVASLNEIVISVCDGMGGEEAGEVASQIAVESIQRCYQNLLQNNLSDEAIGVFVNLANDQICAEISKRKKRLGTTYTLLGIKNGIATASNIGDSRIYRFSNNTLEQISKDHTEAQSMVDSGLISAADSMKIPEKHRLTQHLGIYPYEMIIEPYTVRIEAKAGDRYLLCSDGLTDMLSYQEIFEILNYKNDIKTTVDNLVAKALANGGKDNVTVVICEVADEANSQNFFTQNNNALETKEPDASFENKSEPIKNSEAELLKSFQIDKSNVEDYSDNQTVVLSDSISQISQTSENKNGKKSTIVPIIAVLAVIAVVISFFAGKAVQKKSSQNDVESTTVTEVTTTTTTKKAETTTANSATVTTTSENKSDNTSTTESETTGSDANKSNSSDTVTTTTTQNQSKNNTTISNSN